MSFISFEGMDAKAKGFLLATLLFRGGQSDSCFKFLNEDDRKSLTEKARKLLELPRNKRVSILIAELRLLLMVANQSSLSLVDPSWIVEILEKESETIQLLSLSVIPKSISKSVAEGLGFTQKELGNVPSLPLPLVGIFRQVMQKQLTLKSFKTARNGQ